MKLAIFCARTYEIPSIEFVMFVIPRGQHGGENQVGILPLSASIEEIKAEAAEICQTFGIAMPNVSLNQDGNNLPYYAPGMGMRARIRCVAPPKFEIGEKVRESHSLNVWEVVAVVDEPTYFHDTRETLPVRKVRARLLKNGYEMVSSSFFPV